MRKSKNNIYSGIVGAIVGAIITVLGSVVVHWLFPQVITIYMNGEKINVSQEDYTKLFRENNDLKEQLDNSVSKEKYEELEQKYEEYKREHKPTENGIAEASASEPVELLSLSPYKGDEMVKAVETDNMGKIHTNVYEKSRYSYGGGNIYDNTYAIDGKFSYMTFSLFTPEAYKNDPNVTDLHVYGDGVEIYSYSLLFDEGIKPFDAKIDLSDVNDLRLVMQKTDGRYSGADIVLYLDNILLYP